MASGINAVNGMRLEAVWAGLKHQCSERHAARSSVGVALSINAVNGMRLEAVWAWPQASMQLTACG